MAEGVECGMIEGFIMMRSIEDFGNFPTVVQLKIFYCEPSNPSVTDTIIPPCSLISIS